MLIRQHREIFDQEVQRLSDDLDQRDRPAILLEKIYDVLGNGLSVVGRHRLWSPADYRNPFGIGGLGNLANGFYVRGCRAPERLFRHPVRHPRLTGEFHIFALGLACSAFQSRLADFDEMFWPQVLRGVAIMFCLLPPTRLALGALAEAQVPDASGLFNLMRNLGGAIGIALIDTILYGRTGGHAEALRDRLIAGDVTAAQAIGLDLKLFLHRPPNVTDAAVEAYVRPLVERAAFALSTNEAWALLAGAALLGLLLIPFANPPPQPAEADTGDA